MGIVEIWDAERDEQLVYLSVPLNGDLSGEELVSRARKALRTLLPSGKGSALFIIDTGDPEWPVGGSDVIENVDVSRVKGMEGSIIDALTSAGIVNEEGWGTATSGSEC